MCEARAERRSPRPAGRWVATLTAIGSGTCCFAVAVAASAHQEAFDVAPGLRGSGTPHASPWNLECTWQPSHLSV